MTNPNDIENCSPAERLRREIQLLGATDSEVRALHPIAQREAERFCDAFRTLETYCTFIGYPRSGHSIIGSLLDAHPNMIIAHELDVFRFLEAGFSDRQIYYLLIENSRLFTQHGRQWGQYSFAVPDQWQGKFTELNVIGDNKGGMTTTRIGRNWALLDTLRDTIRLNLKFIHVVRNPFDNIATLTLRQTKDLTRAIDQYFSMCGTNGALAQRLESSQLLLLNHEDFVADPRLWLGRLCEFLGVPLDEGHLNACVNIVYKLPHRSRWSIEWPRAAIDAVHREQERYSFLQRYTFDD